MVGNVEKIGAVNNTDAGLGHNILTKGAQPKTNQDEVVKSRKLFQKLKSENGDHYEIKKAQDLRNCNAQTKFRKARMEKGKSNIKLKHVGHIADNEVTAHYLKNIKLSKEELSKVYQGVNADYNFRLVNPERNVFIKDKSNPTRNDRVQAKNIIKENAYQLEAIKRVAQQTKVYDEIGVNVLKEKTRETLKKTLQKRADKGKLDLNDITVTEDTIYGKTKRGASTYLPISNAKLITNDTKFQYVSKKTSNQQKLVPKDYQTAKKPKTASTTASTAIMSVKRGSTDSRSAALSKSTSNIRYNPKVSFFNSSSTTIARYGTNGSSRYSSSFGGHSIGSYVSNGSANGRTVYQGSRGGQYYMTSGGKKRYI